MTALLKSELIKLLTTRTAYGLLAAAVAVVLLGTFGTLMSAERGSVTGALHEQPFYMLASINVGLFGLVLGIRSFTDEFRHGTVVPTLLATGSRARVVVAKVAVAALAAAAIAVIAAAAMTGLALLLASLRGHELAFLRADVPAMGGLAGAIALWAALGVGVGAVVRQQVAAIVGGLIWILVVENLGTGVLKDAADFLPGQAGHALARATEAGDVLAVPAAAVVFGAYVVLTSLLGATTLSRRDVI